MPMYYAPIKIEYGKKEVKETNLVSLPDGYLTIDQLKNMVGDNLFMFESVEDRYDAVDCVRIVTTRLETDEEQKARIAKEESYMENYRKFHEKRKIIESLPNSEE